MLCLYEHTHVFSLRNKKKSNILSNENVDFDTKIYGK